MRIIRRTEVLRLTGLSRMSQYRLEMAGEFPKRVPLSDNGIMVGWCEEEVLAWIAARLAIRDQAA